MGDPDTQNPTQALLALAQAGDSDAFASLVDPVAMRLSLFLRRRGGQLLGADCDADDLLQQVLIRAWRLLPGFELRESGGIYGWLVSLGDGAVLDRHKYLQAKGRGGVRHYESVMEEDRSSPQPYDPRTSVSKVASRREDYERVDEALQELDPKYRVVVEGHLLEAKSLTQIAGELGLSKNAIWERYHRGMKVLGERVRPVL